MLEGQGHGGDRKETGRACVTRWHPSGLPELQVQGRGQTRQVQQCMEHLHGRAGIDQRREERHKLRGQGRAVPGQELQGQAGQLRREPGSCVWVSKPSSGASGWEPTGHHKAGQDLVTAATDVLPLGRAVCIGPLTFPYITVTQSSENSLQLFSHYSFFFYIHFCTNN